MGGIISTFTDEETEALRKAPQRTKGGGKGPGGGGSLLVDSGAEWGWEDLRKDRALRMRELGGERGWGEEKETDRDRQTHTEREMRET